MQNAKRQARSEGRGANAEFGKKKCEIEDEERISLRYPQEKA